MNTKKIDELVDLLENLIQNYFNHYREYNFTPETSKEETFKTKEKLRRLLYTIE